MSLIPSNFFKSIIAVSYQPPKNGKWESHATGFFYGSFLNKHFKDWKAYDVYLVTNRHVFEKKDGSKHSRVYLSFNSHGDLNPAGYGDLELLDGSGEPTWSASKDVDVAVLRIDLEMLESKKIDFMYFQDDEHAATLKELEDEGFFEGEEVHILGYPGPTKESARNYPVLRHGVIARIGDTFTGRSKTFLIDALITSGNSGGPVIAKPSAFHVSNTAGVKGSYLIGIVCGHLQNYKPTFDQFGKETKVEYKENIGLGVVWPIDEIDKLIAEHQGKYGRPKDS